MSGASGLEKTAEQAAVQASVRRLMHDHVRPRAADIDGRAEFPHDVLALYREHGIFRIAAPVEYGGLDGRLLTLCLAIEEITAVCASSGMVLGNQYLGSGPIALFGSDEQRARYMPGLATGEVLCSFALTEPEAGSDVSAMRTRAVRDGDGWRISGQKIFITHADVADVLTVFAKVDGSTRRSITAFLVDRDTPGWRVDRKEHKMGLRGSTTCSVVIDDVWVPDANRIGDIGDGMRIALGCLNKGRILTASMALGIARGARDEALRHAESASEAGVPVIESQSVQFALAEMETEIEVARSTVHRAARCYDARDADIIRLAAIAKLFSTDMVNRVTSSAVQLIGERGLTREYAAERMMRDARVFAIFEGTNEIQKLVIARELRNRRAAAP